ncbi:hypothetical protein BS78_K237400 [Paspalum vaginatum]|uniref:Magnetochrome domain-containing protein n=1 Tax=Paspalum vaginatum TaxID=158149 RepID=A0A9W7XDL5_9POAL|nr:hypothetical protein BS78_K237400 [Paspalum vaginatum]
MYNEHWIPIITQPHPDGRLKGDCNNCHVICKSGTDFCCVECRVNNLIGGNARDMAIRLVDLAHHFNEATVQLDRFCRVCFHAYSSRSCPNHMSHHLEGAAAGAPVPIRIQEINGLPVVEGHDLLAEDIEEVQASIDGGRIWYPIHARTIDDIPFLIDLEALPCNRADCPELVRVVGLFCSLRCRHQA